MNLKTISITNFRCFRNKISIDLAEPDGSSGSGLTILIGENGNGKTTTLEAINYLTQSKYSTENTLNINDFSDYKESIDISASVSGTKCKSNIDFYKDWHFNITGLSFTAKSRAAKSPGKLLSSPFDIKNNFIPESNYIKSGGEAGKEVDSRDLIFSNSQIDNDELNIFYFDKNRTRQISTGNYKTTLERILDDLNWRFLKDLNSSKEEELLENVSGAYFKQVEKILGSSPGSKLGDELKDFFNNDEYAKLRIDLLNLLHPFTDSEFVVRDDKSLIQKTVKSLGSGVEMIMTILLLRVISSSSKGSIVYLIDEPEMHLHPKAQEKLLELLLEESKNKQVIISTHSPYMFKGVFSTSASLLLCVKGSSGEISINDARDSGWGLFGKSSPTWGEINYFAYDLPSIEFHNELYGFVQAKAIDDDSKNEISLEFDKYLEGNGIPIDIDWTHEKSTGDITYKVTMQTFIRNTIHHPENQKNSMYTQQQLRLSTEKLIEILKI